MTTSRHLRAYRFVTLGDPAGWRDAIRARAAQLDLKGTVLVAEEGINLNLAGEATALEDFVGWLRAGAPFADLQAHYGEAPAIPYRRLKVKHKREIIRMDRPAIRPAAGRAAALAPSTLARWLAAGHDDAGQPLALLDTRNGFEVDAGRFAGAIDWRLARFGEFPAALAAHRAELAGKTVVSYCTGGIRCEKAALLLREQGVDAWQLDGGILGYFEVVGAAHFDGRCFVFDEREAITAR
ncbi:MAG: rhodanese-like domain-containing protein [Burkholderiaceae bacterium]